MIYKSSLAVSFLFFLVNLAEGLSVLSIFLKNQLLFSLILSINFRPRIPFISALNFIIAFLLPS